MPSYSSTSTDEYADQHHLFPTQQNNANGVRSNHPLGEVETVQSSFLQGKLGLNEDNQVVYEPRDEQKGDAARALLYMSLRLALIPLGSRRRNSPFRTSSVPAPYTKYTMAL